MSRVSTAADKGSYTLDCYIGGEWVPASSGRTVDIVNPATGEPFARLGLGDASDLGRAVRAARSAFQSYSAWSVSDRIALLEAIAVSYRSRFDDLVEAVSLEMGAPVSLARTAQVPAGLRHIEETITLLRDYAFETEMGEAHVAREPIGVCGLITPWNWPLNQISCKVAPALAAGCTMVLKPSENAALSAGIFAEVIEQAGVPAGVFNLVHGDGAGVGAAMAAHDEIDMVSFTGSTLAGIAVAKAAAPTVKRVTQELGGKAPYIVFDGPTFEAAVQHAVRGAFRNSGQSCNAPTRLLVPEARADDAVEIAKRVAQELRLGDPADPETDIGPLSNAAQYAKVTGIIRRASQEGARLVAGGPDPVNGLGSGYFVQPTVFSSALPSMRIAREEVFGPVLPILSFKSEDEAVAIANDTEYGLAAFVWSPDIAQSRRVAKRLRAGMVHVNGARTDARAPFGGYKRSGNGREWGAFGLEEFLEVKSIFDPHH